MKHFSAAWLFGFETRVHALLDVTKWLFDILFGNVFRIAFE
jgi:hypothetical protein